MRYVLLGLATFVVCLVLFAPAAPIRAGLQRIPGLLAGSPSGSMWNGSAEITYHGARLGRLSWSYRPQDLLRLRVGYRYALDGPFQRLEGVASLSATASTASVAGSVDATLLTDLLARYDISIGGEFNIPSALEVEAPHNGPPRATGELRWSGGPVQYRLSNVTHNITLPELVAYVETPATGPSATVYARNDDTPLLLASIQPDGWVSIGVTRRFTELVGQPWVGTQSPQTVVMEVQEKLF